MRARRFGVSAVKRVTTGLTPGGTPGGYAGVKVLMNFDYYDVVPYAKNIKDSFMWESRQEVRRASTRPSSP